MRGAIVHARIAAIRVASQGAIMGLLEYLGGGFISVIFERLENNRGKGLSASPLASRVA